MAGVEGAVESEKINLSLLVPLLGARTRARRRVGFLRGRPGTQDVVGSVIPPRPFFPAPVRDGSVIGL